MTTQQVVDLNMKIIYKLANQFYGVDKEDLHQVGVIGVLKAYENYKENGTTKFSTYAHSYIFGEMCNLVYLLNHYKVSKDLIRLYNKIEMTRYTLAQDLGKVPNNLELSKILNMELPLIESATNIGNTVSFDEDCESSRDLKEVVFKEEGLSVDDRLILEESMNQLTEEEREIIHYRYFEDRSQQEVAKLLSLSQAKVSRYENRSLQKMKVFNQVA